MNFIKDWKSHRYLSGKGYDIFYLLVYAYLMTYALLGLASHIYKLDGASVEDSLYNFGGGFVRRGLGGEILFFIRETLHIQPATVIYLIALAAYIFLLAVVARRMRRKGYGLQVLIMSFAFGAVLVYGFDSCRRDFLELSLLAVTLISYRRMRFGWWLVAGNLIMILAILLHEATFFFTVPILVMVTNLRFRSILRSTAV